MKLVIAEKPSVALSLAKVLGATKKHDGYLAGGGYLVSWCYGHLLKLAEPEQYDESLKSWTYEKLPVMPDVWKYSVSADKKKQLAVICTLMKDSSVDSVVCATDAGREGELIFRLVYQYAKCKKKALKNSDRAATMIYCIRRRLAAPVRIGLSESTRQGCLPCCTGAH